MRFLDEYREAERVHRVANAIRRLVTRRWTVMEVCGGQTHAIVRFGLDELLPPEITLLHGPGCPVCVTPIELIDAAIDLAGQEGVTLCSFGDMLRVPGSSGDLLSARAHGGDVRIVYSPLDALELARQMPERRVVLFAVGFETTAPANAMVVYRAEREGIENVSLLVAHVRVPPALSLILGAPVKRVDGVLAAGHVCAVTGHREYRAVAERFRVPIVVTGFEPVDIMRGIYACVRQLETGRFEVENEYARTVRAAGNESAQALVERIFEVTARTWRGIGEIPLSGLQLRASYARFDARSLLPTIRDASEATDCIAGEILTGIKQPMECQAFGSRCTPDRPLGAPMVSSEGACAAYYRYRHAEAAGRA